MSYKQTRLGILGGGQLGKMLIQAAADLNVLCKVLDPDANAPCKVLTNDFIQGKLTDYQTVYEFGKEVEVLTIEIENVNTEAMEALVKEGVRVFPKPSIVREIQDKRLQKQFFQKNSIPTAEFVLIENREDLAKYKDFLPAVQKLGKEGYDGRGVQKILNENDISKGFDAPSLIEKLIDFEKEISVIVARNENGEVKTFPVVELVFNPVYNLVEYLFAPANISKEVEQEANRIATLIVEKWDFVGLLAVEMFLTKDQQVLVNEVAPRPHNSGHHTIEANYVSQYEQHLRAILNLPLGSTHAIMPAAMVNLLGAAGFSGIAQYENLEKVLALEGAYVHLYGKAVTKPFRKMGHVTLLDQTTEGLHSKVDFVKHHLKVVSDEYS
ncbi:5-(carboxyamino)imidazole ribonucleotide synthase [Thermoflexibacter ruber]|uniref:N5-carboxyaminoimidazole ribonucleotide synthase n=1 Tax=Thermoflexibacter ruber TaxID=1003 RepID=A0A1I2BLV7_9BACT|nr:5-(carboxyamino)imidazole ribonucleotide synthase [Thermoflexibacter ruber]SFE57145.1 5-(carboxyamino)imidazole ribonucleotide synthase [Thermoflexibacter ruber]